MIISVYHRQPRRKLNFEKYIFSAFSSHFLGKNNNKSWVLWQYLQQAMKNVLTEAVFVGSLLMVIVKMMDTLKFRGDTNARVFVAGVVVHIFCEIVGLNRWYCMNGAACG